MSNRLKIFVILLLIFLLGLAARSAGGIWTMMFTYDQGRDAFGARSILMGDWKIVGPPTDIPGLHHGPLYYYVLAALYGIAGGDPSIAMASMLVINLFCLIPIGLLTQALFKNKRLTMVSMILFATSYEAISYARWLSNPPIALLAMGIFYLGLWKTIEKKKYGFLITAVGAGLAIQAELFLAYLIPVVLLGIILFCHKAFLSGVSWTSRINFFVNKASLCALGVFLAIVSSYFIAEAKFGFMGWHSLLGFLGGNGPRATSLMKFENYLKGWREVAERNIAFLNPPAAFPALVLLIFLVAFLFIKYPKHRRPILYLVFLSLSSIPIFIVTGHYLQFINVGMVFPLLIMTAFVLVKTIRSFRLSVILIWLFVTINIFVALPLTRLGNFVFQVQAEFRLKDELSLVADTYRQANGRPFSLAAISNPLHMPTTWAYLFWWYATKNNLPLPIYHADTELSYAGDKIFTKSREIYDLEFVIIEPEINAYWQKKDLGEETIRTDFLGQKMFNRIILQTRAAKKKIKIPTTIDKLPTDMTLPQ